MIGLIALGLFCTACSGPEPIQSPFRNPKISPERRANDLLRRMRRDEKIALLRGVRAMSLRAYDRLGIPALTVVRGAMGISEKGILATAFPANIGMAATWNPALVEAEGAVIGQQARRLGRSQVLGPFAEVSLQALDGRTFETYGEDPWLASRLVAGFVSGVQGEGPMATAIYNGGPGDRATALQPLEAAVSEAGVWSVMPGAGDPAGQVVGDVLEGRLAFRGFAVFSKPVQDDFANAPDAVIDERVRTVLRGLFTSGAFDAAESTKTGEPETPAQRAVARNAAARSIVLLKNDAGLLPLDLSKVSSVVIAGPNAAVNRMGAGNFTVATGRSVSALEALRGLFGGRVVVTGADVAIVFAGTGAGSEGETIHRSSAELPKDQQDIIASVAKANRKTVVVLTNGAPVAVGNWIDNVSAVLEAWFPGEEGGNAIADVLTGAVNPSGRLPVTMAPQFPFGFGLSYTQFEYGELIITPPDSRAGQLVEVSLTVRNSGRRAGKETVQLYVHALAPVVDQPPQQLKAFQQVDLNPGESKRVSFALTERATSHFDSTRQDWTQDYGAFEVRVGSSSRDIRATGRLSVYE